jgi:phosphonate transport system substrate-binding protein
MKRRTFVATAGIAGAWVSGVYGETPSRPLSVGIVPQQSPGELTRLWTPVLKYLESKTGLALHLETAKDVTTFQKRMVAGEYDIVHANPLIYATVLHPRLNYEAFAREKDRKLVGLLVVRKDSRYQSLSDLAGTELAFPAEDAMAASIIPRAVLDKQGIAYTPHYVGSHDSVYLTVEKGLYAAGGGIARVFEIQPAQVKEHLRVLWTSPAYPPHPFAAHPRVPAAAVKSLQVALLAMSGDAGGLEILKPLAFTGFMETRDADYESLRSLGYKLAGV